MNHPDERSAAEAIRKMRIRRLAYRSANRHLVDAGLGLASAGVRRDSPEMRAIDFALHRLNRAGGIETPKPPRSMKEIRHETPHPGLRPGPGPSESVA